MDKDKFLRLLCNDYKDLAKGRFTDYDDDIVNTYNDLIKSGEITVFHGFICNVSGKVGDDKYALVPYTGSYQELQEDSEFTEYHYWRAVAEKRMCHVCGKTYFVSGEADACPYCKN
jgi:hypothetical protein